MFKSLTDESIYITSMAPHEQSVGTITIIPLVTPLIVAALVVQFPLVAFICNFTLTEGVEHARLFIFYFYFGCRGAARALGKSITETGQGIAIALCDGFLCLDTSVEKAATPRKCLDCLTRRV